FFGFVLIGGFGFKFEQTHPCAQKRGEIFFPVTGFEGKEIEFKFGPYIPYIAVKIEPPGFLKVVVVKIVVTVYVEVIDPKFQVDPVIEHVFGKKSATPTGMSNVIIGIEVTKIDRRAYPTASFHSFLSEGYSAIKAQNQGNAICDKLQSENIFCKTPVDGNDCIGGLILIG